MFRCFAVGHLVPKPVLPGPLACLVSACLAWACLGLGTAAQADLIVTAESTSAYTGTLHNAFEFTLENSGPDDVIISAFTMGFSISNPSLALTDLTYDTLLATYIFQGNSMFGPSLFLPPLTTPVMFADVYDIPGGSITLLAGQTVGLGTLWFDAPSERQVIQIVLDPSMISFAHDVNLYPDSQIQLVDGTLSIVPEPGTLSLLLMATALVGVGQSRHRRPARN
jgi:hypothetical protein